MAQGAGLHLPLQQAGEDLGAAHGDVHPELFQRLGVFRVVHPGCGAGHLELLFRQLAGDQVRLVLPGHGHQCRRAPAARRLQHLGRSSVAADHRQLQLVGQTGTAALVPLDHHRRLAPLQQRPGQMEAHLAAAHDAHPRPLRLFAVGFRGQGRGRGFGSRLPPGVRVGFCQKGVRRQLGGAHQLQPEALAVHLAAGRVLHAGNGLGHPKQLFGHLGHHQVHIVLPGHGQHRAAALHPGLMQGVCINGRAVNGRPVKALLHQFFQRLGVPVQHGNLMAPGPQGRHQPAAGAAAAHDENVHTRFLSGRAGSARRGILLYIISDLLRLASKPALLCGFGTKGPVFGPARLLFFCALWYTGNRFMRTGFHQQVLFPDGRRCFFGRR